MNFVGHALVACRTARDSGWVLGAMLPDFLSMARARIDDPGDARVAAGVELHHRTDRAFHGDERFVELCREGVEALTAAGVRRGPARAVAHVGTELLLDGILLTDPNPESAALPETFAAAVAAAAPEALGAQLRFSSPAAQARFFGLQRRLVEWGVPLGYRDPAFVADRLVDLLRRRTSLALHPPEEHAVRAWLEGHQADVGLEADAILDALRAALA